MPVIPYIPETAPFTIEQRAWLNGFLAGLFSQVSPVQLPAPQPNGSPNSSSEPLLILFGSQTGTAEGIARRIASESKNRGFNPQLLVLNDYEKANLPAGGKAIIISSTWGEGDPPDNAVTFWDWLKSDQAPRLEKLQFAVLGLGDKNYSDFCGASKKFDARLEALGGRRLIARGECDVDYEAGAKIWSDELWSKLGNGLLQGPTLATLPNGATRNGYHSSNGASGAAQPLHSKSNPFPARLLKNVLLNKPGSSKEVRHYEISLAGSSLVYEPGDALGVMPMNCPELVNDCLAALGCAGDELVTVGESTLPLHEALTCHYEIRQPTPELLAAVAQRAPGTELEHLLAPDKAADLKQWLWGREVVDALQLAKIPFTPAELLPLLRKLTPRLYSISSSSKAHPDEVHLTVSTVRFQSFGRGRKGVASVFLADRAAQAGSVKVFVQPARGFKLPLDTSTAIIMVGPGTGIAPFRAFLEERQTIGANGKNWLFFGDQRRATDFLYQDQLLSWQSSSLLTRLDLAFSRDQAEKVYVQNCLLTHGAEIWAWLQEGAHFYVCGDASRMAKDVDMALHRIIETAGGKSAEAAEGYIAKLKSEKRYQRDVY